MASIKTHTAIAFILLLVILNVSRSALKKKHFSKLFISSQLNVERPERTLITNPHPYDDA